MYSKIIFCIFTLFVIVAFIIFCYTKESFQNIQFNQWENRLNELKNVDTKYKQYFKSLAINDHSLSFFQPNKIFVSVASYRDNQCSDTIKNIAENADNPENLVIVICQQNDPKDEDCLVYCNAQNNLPLCKQAKTEIIKLLHTQARGPVWARHLVQQKWSGEEFFLQIDSHTRLVKHWDTLLKNQLSLCGPKAILSQYPLEFDNIDKKDRGDPEKEKWRLDQKRKGLYVKEIGKEGFTRIQSEYETEQVPRKPYPATGIAAGFIFAKGQFVKDVPIDPFLYLFFGEQMDIAVRAFTNGYNIFSPTINIAFHIYDRSHRKTFWELTNQKPLEVLSRFRLYVKLGMISIDKIPKKYHFILIGINRYGLGTKRTISEYEKIAKINIRDEKMLTDK